MRGEPACDRMCVWPRRAGLPGPYVPPHHGTWGDSPGEASVGGTSWGQAQAIEGLAVHPRRGMDKAVDVDDYKLQLPATCRGG